MTGRDNAKMLVLLHGLLVILPVGLRQTPRIENTLKVPCFFVCISLDISRNNGVSEKPLSE